MIISAFGQIATDANVNLSRRSLLRGLGTAGIILAAPSVVRAASLMDIRGVPLRRSEFIPCDGRIINEFDEPELFNVFRAQSGQRLVHRFGSDGTGAMVPAGIHDDGGRQYGGTAEDKTFAVPDFQHGFDYDLGARAEVRYELDRSGELYMSVIPIESMKDSVERELSLPLGRDAAVRLLNGERIKV